MATFAYTSRIPERRARLLARWPEAARSVGERVFGGEVKRAAERSTRDRLRPRSLDHAYARGWKPFVRVTGTRARFGLSNEATYAEWVEKGRPPGGRPPKSRIERYYIEQEGLGGKDLARAVYFTRNKIAREGTKGHWVLRDLRQTFTRSIVAGMIRPVLRAQLFVG